MLLSFVYTGHYILPPPAHKILANEALLHLQAYTAGQRCLVAGLKEMAKQRFLDLAGSTILRVDVLQEVVSWLYHCIPDSNDLRILRKQLTLIMRPELDSRMWDKKFRKLLRKEPEFAVDLLMASFDRRKPQGRSVTLWCDRCDKVTAEHACLKWPLSVWFFLVGYLVCCLVCRLVC